MIGVGNYITTLKNQISSLQTTVNSGNSSPFSSSQTFTSSGTWVRPTGVDWVTLYQLEVGEEVVAHMEIGIMVKHIKVLVVVLEVGQKDGFK